MNWTLLSNTLLVAATSTVGAVALGFFAALCGAGLGGKLRTALMAVAVIVLMFPPFLTTNCWIDLLGENGLWRTWFPLNVYSLKGTVWILALQAWPIPFFLILASWRRMEASLLEVDPLLTGTALIRWLLEPMARVAIFHSAVLTFVLAMNNFAVPAILQVKVYPAEIWVNFNTMFDYNAALKMCWPMVLAPLLLVLVLRRSDVVWNWRADAAPARIFRSQTGKAWFWSSAVVLVLAIFFSFWIPLFHLMTSRLTWSELWPAFAAGQTALLNSGLLSVVVATLVVAVAVLTWRWRLESVLWIPFFVPGVLLGIALIWIFNRPCFGLIYPSAMIVILAFGVRYVALGWNCVVRAIGGADPVLGDVARLEGATRWQVFRHALWPQISSAALVGWYVTYLLCLWDVETMVLIMPPGFESVAVRIFNLLHYGHNSQVDALCLLLLVLALLPLVVWSFWRLCSLRVFRAFVVCLAVLAVVTGCSKAPQDRMPIQSQFFSEVRIIGTRGTGLGQFNKPRSVAVDTKDNIFVVDMTGRIQKFSPDGVFLKSFQMPQTEKGKAKGMCRDRAGNIVVIEPHYCRVNVFSPELVLISQWGKEGTNFGQLAFPRSVAVNSRNEYLISEYHLVERVQRFTPTGDKCLATFGKLGTGPGEMNRVEGLDVDSKGQIHAADSCNHRIQVFSSDGKFLRAFGKAGQGLGELSYPLDVRVDTSGLEFVCEFGNSRIHIFDTNGRPLEILGHAGGDPGQFSNPWSICLDSQGNLIVADGMNHRVQKFIRKPNKNA